MTMTQTDFERDSQLEFKLADKIKAVLGQIFIQRDIVADIFEGTDFAIFKVTPFRVAARLRRYECYEKWPTQFTIRWSRPSGVKTEIGKIREGLVDYLLYGFMNWTESEIVHWTVADLNIFRIQDPMPLEIKENRNGDSTLAAFDWHQFPPEFIIASSEEASR